MPDLVDNVLAKLAELIAERRFESLETDGLERGGYIVRAGRGGFVLNQKYRAGSER